MKGKIKEQVLKIEKTLWKMDALTVKNCLIGEGRNKEEIISEAKKE